MVPPCGIASRELVARFTGTVSNCALSAKSRYGSGAFPSLTAIAEPSECDSNS